MARITRRLAAARRGGDSGIAIVAAMAVVMLVGIMLAVVISIAVSEANQSGRDRQRSSGIATAEGRLDLTVATIQSGSPAALATLCAPAGTTATSGVSGDTFDLVTIVQYFAADGTAIPCSQAMIEAIPVAQAKVAVEATADQINGTLPAQRGIEALVELTPSFGDAFDKAIFSDGDVATGNKVDLNPGPGGAPADVYTNQDFDCANNEAFYGAVEAQGNITGTNSCDIHGDAWAGGYVATDGSNWHGNFEGDIKAPAYISIDGNAHVTGSMISNGTVSGAGCPSGPRCYGNGSAGTVTGPTAISFPKINWDGTTQSAWVAEGFTNVVTLPDATYTCGTGNNNGINKWLNTVAPTLTTKTILIVSCSTPVTVGNKDVQLRSDLVIVSPSGFDFAGSSITTASGVAQAKIYVIQPYTYYGAAPSCATNGITMTNNFQVTNSVNALFYARCTIDKQNKTVFNGQMYSGTLVQIGNNTGFTYAQLPVWGDVVAQTSIPSSYDTSVLYKREVS